MKSSFLSFHLLIPNTHRVNNAELKQARIGKLFKKQAPFTAGKKSVQKKMYRTSHPLKYYLPFDAFAIAIGIKAQATQNIQLKKHVIKKG